MRPSPETVRNLVCGAIVTPHEASYGKKGTLDELLSGRDPNEVFSKDSLFDELKKALAERVLNAELDEHLDGEAAAGKANHRNGSSSSGAARRTASARRTSGACNDCAFAPPVGSRPLARPVMVRRPSL